MKSKYGPRRTASLLLLTLAAVHTLSLPMTVWAEDPPQISQTEPEEASETVMENWKDQFEITLEEQVLEHNGRKIPNHRYILAVKDDADWAYENFTELVVSYRYHVKKFYYTVDTDGEIVLEPDPQWKETITQTIVIGSPPYLLAEKGTHGHTSDGRFLVHLPTDVEIIGVSKKVYPSDSLDHYISLETNGLIPPETEQRISDLLHETYPGIFAYFAGGRYEKITCRIEIRDGIASTRGRDISVSAEYLNQHPHDLDCITHELIHCAQAYPSNAPGWLTEGIADYGRYLFGLYNESAGWALPDYSQSHSYMDGYRTTAAFLKYVAEHHEADIVSILNDALQKNAYSDALWMEHTGHTAQALWEMYGRHSNGEIIEPPLSGDVNGDGLRNPLDLVLLRQHLAGWSVTLDLKAADVTGDGQCNAMDLIRLRQYLAGWDVPMAN